MKLLCRLLLMLLPVQLLAQEKFIFEGRIEYERKINMHRQMPQDEEGIEWFKDYVKKEPVFHNSLFSLHFKGNETIYRLSGELVVPTISWLFGPSKENIIHTNLDKRSRNSFKSVFDDTYLIADSITQMNWRITDEKREIAGMECRKAVGIICDSVYVVAFYSDEIPVSGGPESFNGLPGMILGLVIPRLHTTWFATKIALTAPAAQDFVISKKGQRMDRDKLYKTLQNSMSNWGPYAQRNLWWVML